MATAKRKRVALSPEILRREVARLMGARGKAEAAELVAEIDAFAVTPEVTMRFIVRGHCCYIEFKLRDLYRMLDTFSPRYLAPAALALADKVGRLGKGG
jgi:hypothetical protein